MVIIKDWKKYYTLEESIKISDDYIKKSALELTNDLKKARKNISENKKEIYV